MKDSKLTVTAFDWVPELASGQVRDLRLRWALREAGFPYDVELVPMGRQTEEPNIVRQPFGQVPALLVDGRPIFESGACLWRIAEASDTLLPDEPAERDSCLSWLFAALNSIEPPLTMLARLTFMEMDPAWAGLPDGAAPKACRDNTLAWLDERLGQFCDALGERETIVADRLTIADIALVTVLLTAHRFDVLSRHARAQAYFDRHSAREAFRRAQEEQIETHRRNAAKYETTES